MKTVSLVAVLIVATSSAFAVIQRPHVFVKNDGRWPAHVLYMANADNGNVWITTTGMIVDVNTRDKHGYTVNKTVRYQVIGSGGSSAVSSTTNSGAPLVSILTMDRKTEPMQIASVVVVHDVLSGIDLEYFWDNNKVSYNVRADVDIAKPENLFDVEVWNPDKGMWSPEIRIGIQGPGNKELPLNEIVRIFTISGNEDEGITSIKRKTDGSYVVGGWTTSVTYKDVSPGVISPTRGANTDGFVAILDADLKTITKWVYISGSGNDRVNDLVIRPNGQVCAVGETNSSDFPVKGNIGKTPGGLMDGFLVVLSGDMSTQVAGAYIPGNRDDVATGVAVNGTGNVVIVGTTNSESGLATFVGHSDTLSGGKDAFAMLMHTDFTSVLWFTYLGGSEDDSFASVIYDGNSQIVACGKTTSEDLFTWPQKVLVQVGTDPDTGEPIYEAVGKNAYSIIHNGGTTDAFVAKFAFSGELLFSTYLGGNAEDEATGLFTDDDNSVYIAGTTNSNNLPVENSGSMYYGQKDGFVAGLTIDGVRLRGAAYIGGASNDIVTGMVKVENGIGAVIGYTESLDFPVLGPGTIANVGTSVKAFLTNIALTELKFATVLSIQSTPFPSSVVLDPYRNAIIAGRVEEGIGTNSVDGAGDAFVTKWAYGTLTYRLPVAPTTLCIGKSVSVKWETLGINVADPFDVDFSTDNGATWTVIATNTKNREYSYRIPESTPVTAQCKFRVRSIHGHAESTPSPLSVAAIPLITSQPQSVTPCPNVSVTLSVTAEGTGNNYQWRKNGSLIAGAVGSEYIIPSVRVNDDGVFDVIVANACQSKTSETATITVLDKPIIDVQPQSTSAEQGARVVFNVVVRGWGLTYQWKRNGYDIPNATEPTYEIISVTTDDAGTYSTSISSPCGSVVSSEAVLTINGTTSVDDDHTTSVNRIKIQPHPVSDVMMLNVPAISKQALLIVRDVQGAEVYRLEVPASSDNQIISISASHFTAGTYSALIVGDDVVLTSTFIVLHQRE